MIGYSIIGIFLVLLAVLLLRALCFRPKKQPTAAPEAVSFDRDAATAALQKLVQCKTISYNDASDRKSVV